MVGRLDARQPLWRYREPATLAEAFEVQAQPPIQRRAGDVAEGGSQQQECCLVALGQQQPGQRGFRLQGEQGGGAEGQGAQAQVDAQGFQDGISMMVRRRPVGP